MNTTIDSTLPSSHGAEAKVNQSINRLEESMDQLVTHVSQTRDTVDHAKYVMRGPGRFVRHALKEIIKEPALYFAVGWSLGIIFYVSTHSARRRQF